MFRFSKNKKSVASDHELLRVYRETGRLEVLGELYDHYLHVVYGTCLKYLKNREDSRDAVMQIFEKLVNELRVREVENMQTWLYVVAKNFCLMKLRSNNKEVSAGNVEENIIPVFMDSADIMHPLSGNQEEIASRGLEQCMEELPDGQKKCISLFYYKGKCYEEITRITGFDLKKVKSHLQNGRRNLKNCMEKHHVKKKETS